MKAGDTLRFVRVSSFEARMEQLHQTERMEALIVRELDRGQSQRKTAEIMVPTPALEPKPENGILYEREASVKMPRVRYRQGADQHLIICYGDDTDRFDLNNDGCVEFFVVFGGYQSGSMLAIILSLEFRRSVASHAMCITCTYLGC